MRDILCNYEENASTSEIDLGRQHTTTLSPDTTLKLPKGIKPFPSLMTPPKMADLGKFKSLINLLVILEFGLTTNSKSSAFMLVSFVIATTSPFLIYLKMLFAANNFLLIKVSTPIFCDKWI